MRTLARIWMRAKLRCGGLTAQAFPSVESVADFIAARRGAECLQSDGGIASSGTPRIERTGFTMHGFLNVLVAAALAPHVDAATLRADRR